MSVIVKGGGGKSSGLYVWAKYNADIGLGESINNIALANDGTTIDIYVKENLYIKEDGTIGVQGEPYSTVSISSVVEDTCIGGMTPTKYCIGVDGNVYSSPLSHIAGSVDNCLANLVKVVKSTFIDFVVSDSETAYPDGAVHTDGFYYEIFDKTGLYVWKKYEHREKLIVSEPHTVAGQVPFTALSGSICYDSNGNCLGEFNDSSITNGATYFLMTSDSSSYILKMVNRQGNAGVMWKYTDFLTPVHDFIDYVISDDPTAYPDGDIQDGYWYEKVVEGKAGIDFGEVTLAQAAKSVTVSHKLGVVPSWVALVPKELPSSSINDEFTYANFNRKALRSAPSLGYTKSEVTNTLTETEVTFNCYVSNKTDYSFFATNYYWFAIA